MNEEKVEVTAISLTTKKNVWHDAAIFVRPGMNVEAILKNTLDNNLPTPTHHRTEPNTYKPHKPQTKIWYRLARFIAKQIFGLLKPLFLPIAVRWRAYLISPITAELQKNADIQIHKLNLLQRDVAQIREAIHSNNSHLKAQAKQDTQRT